jgi:heterodisulfide reductase subunit A-like polyferredoxin
MVVLATAIEPDQTAKSLATMLTASIDTNNFFTEAHPKLRPVESPTAGVFLSGVCQGPKDIPETVAQASAAAVKVIGLLSRISLSAILVWPDQTSCSATAAPIVNMSALTVRSIMSRKSSVSTVRSRFAESPRSMRRSVRAVVPALSYVRLERWTSRASQISRSWRR